MFSWIAWNLGQGSFHVWHMVEFWPMTSRVHWWVILVLCCLYCIGLEKVLAGFFHIYGGSVLYVKFVLFSHLPSVWGAYFHCLCFLWWIFWYIEIPIGTFTLKSPRYCFDKRVCIRAFSLVWVHSSYSCVVVLTPGAWPCGVLMDRMGCPLQSCLSQKTSIFYLLTDPILLHSSEADAFENFHIFCSVPFAV